jgi:hypothetical protein
VRDPESRNNNFFYYNLIPQSIRLLPCSPPHPQHGMRTSSLIHHRPSLLRNDWLNFLSSSSFSYLGRQKKTSKNHRARNTTPTQNNHVIIDSLPVRTRANPCIETLNPIGLICVFVEVILGLAVIALAFASVAQVFSNHPCVGWIDATSHNPALPASASCTPHFPSTT